MCSVSDRTHAVIAAYIKSQGRTPRLNHRL
ncbi:hypothetical protein B5F87_17475 [Eubacterium sp. An3]|nr:hypothetical protein B5F87_17475 [Eubacterium sp. An3]